MLDNTSREADYTRSRDGYHHVVRELSNSLPAPTEEPPEVRYRRIQAGVSAVASLCPVNQAEADLAARHVAAGAQALDCMRLSTAPGLELTKKMQCLAQSASMGRQADAALRSLLRLQAMRTKRDANPKTADAAAWAEHIALSAMTRPPPEEAPVVERSPVDPVTPQVVDDESSAPEPAADALSEVEMYEIIYPQRAALIRRHGGVPANVSFGPPDEEIVQGLLAKRPPLLREVG